MPAGPAQGILVQDTAALETSPVELKGKGTTPFDLGFTKDSQVVGFTRDPVAAANVPRVYHGFDLGRRRSRPVTRDQLAGAIKEYAGYSLRNNLNWNRRVRRRSTPTAASIPFAINPVTRATVVVVYLCAARAGASARDRGVRHGVGHRGLRPRDRPADPQLRRP